MKEGALHNLKRARSSLDAALVAASANLAQLSLDNISDAETFLESARPFAFCPVGGEGWCDVKRLEAQWQELERRAMAKDAGPAQRSDMRKSFYAGATAVLHLLVSNVSDSDEPTEQDMSLMEEISNELQEFGQELARAAAAAKARRN